MHRKYLRRRLYLQADDFLFLWVYLLLSHPEAKVYRCFAFALDTSYIRGYHTSSYPVLTLSYPTLPLVTLQARNGNLCNANAFFSMYVQNSIAPMTTNTRLVM